MTSMLASAGNATANDITAALDGIAAALKTKMTQEGLIVTMLLLVYVAHVFFAVAQAALRVYCVRDRYVQHSTQFKSLWKSPTS